MSTYTTHVGIGGGGQGKERNRLSAAVLLVFLMVFSITPPTSAATFSTEFDLVEDPVSEAGAWINGMTDGLDWADCATTNGYIYGLQSGQTGYDDATALLAGTWGSNQTAGAIVYLGERGSYDAWEEVEIRLRSAITANVNNGYEVIFSTKPAPFGYVQIVRWNGPLASYNYVNLTYSVPELFVVNDGDEVKGEIIGSTINAYINGVLVASGTEETYTTGSPGVGFYHQLPGGNLNYGFKSFWATDSPEDNQVPVPASPTLERYTNAGFQVPETVLAGSDPDGDLVSVLSVEASSEHGASVYLADGWVHYSPPLGLTNTDSFEYTVSDGRDGVATGTATIVVITNSGPLLTYVSHDPASHSVRIIGRGIPNRRYTIRYSDSMDQPKWLSLGTAMSNELGVFIYIDFPPSGRRARYYRAMAP
jgi:hypothetical protein